MMKIRSAKSKGKILEKWICNHLKDLYIFFDDDIRTTISSENGADIKFSKNAQKRFPYKIEAKNRERLGLIYTFYEQAKEHEGDNLEPIVVIKSNRKRPLVIVDAEHFFKLTFKCQ